MIETVMPMDVDRHPALSANRLRLFSHEDMLVMVRRRWPDAWMDGSTGFERTFLIRLADGDRIVAHGWSPARLRGQYWIRIALTIDDTLTG